MLPLYISSCSTGFSGACLVSKVELLLFSLVGLVSLYYMLVHVGSVAAQTLSQFGSLVPLLEQDVCLKLFSNTFGCNVLVVFFTILNTEFTTLL